MTISNEQFLGAIFKKSDNVHVTDFTYDPNDIPKDKHLKSWKGDYFKKYQFQSEPSNQYFTISLFESDDENIARRRKALFKSTHVITLDDVKEKLSITEVVKLPKPSYIMETSPGSEQWGYILNNPCTDRYRVENLLDGLVSNGLAPEGKDPGMKGVTRYVRLPNGYNTKKSKMINGEPYKCKLIEWSPFETVSLEDLAKPFNVNLDATRREQRVDGATNVPDHPLLHSCLNIKEVRSDGRFDITCPWVDEHTGSIDDGSAIFTNDDGSPGFKCHHGACETRTAKDLINYLEDKEPGFRNSYKEWQFKRTMSSIPLPPCENTSKENSNILKTEEPISEKQKVLDQLRRSIPGSEHSRKIVSEFLKLIDDMSEIEKHYYHQEVCEILGWSKVDFSKILKGLREEWYQKKNASFYDTIVFIKEQNQFYDFRTKIFYTPESFQNSFAHEDIDARKEALTNNRVKKVDKIDFAPKKSRFFEENGIMYANTWNLTDERKGVKGDCTPWLNHWETLGWGKNRKHMLQWMAFTLLHPDIKINHILLLGGMEGTGKDFLLYPFIQAMGEHSETAEGHELLSSFADYLLNYKHLHINETELGDHKDATTISNKLKPLAAAPPSTLRINMKNKNPIKVRNIVNLTMTTNSQMPIKLNGPSRRFYAVWSDFNQRNTQDEIIPEWLEYWDNNWKWMYGDGVDHCIWYLRNCVDLSDFNPGSPPPMTDFLKSIRESSKSPAQQTIEAFIDNNVGAFSNDIITANDACATLKADLPGCDEFMYTDTTWFTPVKVGRIMRDIHGCVKLRAKKDTDVKVWVIRNKEVYINMSASELSDAYTKQKS